MAIHEIVETITDPLAGWKDPYNHEIADKCPSADYTQLGTKTFWIPTVWSNADQRCLP
jgi:hypothetical protein